LILIMLLLLKLTILFGIVAKQFCLATEECPPGLTLSGSNCFKKTYGDATRTPYGVTECDQLEAICGTYNGQYESSGTGADTKCKCSTNTINDCFEDNKLYVEDALPLPMTLEQCFKACQSVTACQFFTWNQNSQSCGLRCYKPNVLISVPGSGQRTGTRDGGIAPDLDSIYVADAFMASKKTCKISCEFDLKCISVTYTEGSFSSYGRCVKNYGPTIRVLSLFTNSGISSCQPCP